MQVFSIHKTFNYAASIWLLAVSFSLLAQERTRSLQLPIESASRSQSNHFDIANHPFASSKAEVGLPLVFDLSHQMAVGLDEAVTNSLRGVLDSRIEVRSSEKTPVMRLTDIEESREFNFFINGIKLCQFTVKAHSLRNEPPVVLGIAPKVEDLNPASIDEWPAEAKAFEYSAAAIADSGVGDMARLISKEACLYSTGSNEFVPVWEMVIKAGFLLYDATSDGDTVYKLEPRSYDAAAGAANIYPNNLTDDTVKKYSLGELEGDSILRNKYFYTALNTSLYSAAKAADHNFVFQPGSSEFDETSIFTNANRTLEWFQSIGYASFGDKPIRLNIHAIIREDKNNALYQPGAASENPAIFVGDGDGEVLQNLATDGDVVSHEFGHHVVYQSVKNVSGESLVLHEGYADYFTFARTGNTCLGESICPKGSIINCAVESKCLRTAENDLKFGAADLPAQPHLRSQFISGMLWDLRSKDVILPEDVDKLVLKSIDFLITDSGYEHMVLGLLLADKSLYSGKNCAKIYNRAIARGLGSKITKLGCNNEFPSVSEVEIASESAKTLASSTKKKGGGFCGIGTYSASPRYWTLLLLMALPVLLVNSPRRLQK